MTCHLSGINTFIPDYILPQQVNKTTYFQERKYTDTQMNKHMAWRLNAGLTSKTLKNVFVTKRFLQNISVDIIPVIFCSVVCQWPII